MCLEMLHMDKIGDCYKMNQKESCGFRDYKTELSVTTIILVSQGTKTIYN